MRVLFSSRQPGSMTPPVAAASVQRSRDLRKNQTHAEAALWRRLRRRGLDGLKFRRQEAAGGYFVDFLCKEARLVIELDGGGHAADDQRRYDEQRTEALERRGLRILRFWNTDVLENIEGVLQQILEAAKTPSPPPPSPETAPSPREGRGSG